MDIDFLKKLQKSWVSFERHGGQGLETVREASVRASGHSAQRLLLQAPGLAGDPASDAAHGDDIFTGDITAGQHKIRRTLWNRHGVKAGRDRMKTLMERMNIHPIYPKQDLSFPKRDEHKFPYLLHGVKITHANQVWSTDIRYIRLRDGFCYLTAVIDWYSRRILSWRLSNMLSAVFCMECVNEAFERYGRPEIFNTDQGSQYTSQDFTGLFEARDKEGNFLTRLSMDSKGRAYENVLPTLNLDFSIEANKIVSQVR